MKASEAPGLKLEGCDHSSNREETGHFLHSDKDSYSDEVGMCGNVEDHDAQSLLGDDVSEDSSPVLENGNQVDSTEATFGFSNRDVSMDLSEEEIPSAVGSRRYQDLYQDVRLALEQVAVLLSRVDTSQSLLCLF